jgi:hypothetical protein
MSCHNTFVTFALNITSSHKDTEESDTSKSTIGVFILSQARVIKYFEPVISSEVILASLLSFITATK